MKRREFLCVFSGAAAAWPRTTRAQQFDRIRRVAILFGQSESDPEAQSWFAIFRQALLNLGWTEGRNIQIDYRWTAADTDRARLFATELVNMAPDVIFATNTLTLAALRQTTKTISIVFVQVSDPVGNKFVQSMARPGGNITGFSHFDYEIGGKWLEVLKEAAPSVTQVAVIFGLENPASPKYLRTVEAVAGSFGVRVVPAGVRDNPGIEHAFGEISRRPNSGLIVQPSPVTIRQRKQIVALAAKHRLPAVYPFRFFATDGGLVSYGVSTAEQHRQAASYIDRILRGEKPADLPVQAPTKFELVINLKTATALGVEIPPTLIARADEVIE